MQKSDFYFDIPRLSESGKVIGFTSFGAAADYTNVNIGLAAAIMFKILRFSLRTLCYNQNDRF